MSTCTRCGWHHSCPKCGHTSSEPWGGGRRARRTAGHARAVALHASIREARRLLLHGREVLARSRAHVPIVFAVDLDGPSAGYEVEAAS